MVGLGGGVGGGGGVRCLQPVCDNRTSREASVATAAAAAEALFELMARRSTGNVVALTDRPWPLEHALIHAADIQSNPDARHRSCHIGATPTWMAETTRPR